MNALQLMKHQLGILDDGDELDEFYNFYIEAARNQILSQNGKFIDDNNPNELKVLVDLAVEMTKVDREKEPEYLKINRVSLMLED